MTGYSRGHRPATSPPSLNIATIAVSHERKEHRFRGKAQRQATADRCKAGAPADSWRIKQVGDQLKSAAAQYVKLHQETVPELALACAGLISEPIRDRPHGRGCTGGTDPRIQAKQGLAGRIPAAVRTRLPCAGDPRWARRLASAVLILRVLMLQCRRVTGVSLERPGSFLA
jgi:hypothetical protein